MLFGLEIRRKQAKDDSVMRLMPSELRKAHQANDRAVMTAYGFNAKMTESECVAELFRLYEKLTR